MSASAGRRGVFAAAAVLAVVAGVAGCQGDDGGKAGAAGAAGASGSPDAKAAAKPPAPGAALEAVYKKASAGVKSARVAMSIEMAAPAPALAAGGGSATPVVVKESGTMGWDPTATDMTVTMGAEGKTVAMEARIVDGAFYVNMSRLLSTGRTGGKPWIHYGVDELGKLSGAGASSGAVTGVLRNGAQDPSEIVGLLLKSPHLKDIGKETTGGVAAEHYAGTLTLDDMTRNTTALGGLSPSATQQLVRQSVQQGVTSQHIDLWVGEDGRPVRDVNSTTTAAGVIKVDVRYSHYSALPANVQAPPAGATADLADVLKQQP